MRKKVFSAIFPRKYFLFLLHFEKWQNLKVKSQKDNILFSLDPPPPTPPPTPQRDDIVCGRPLSMIERTFIQVSRAKKMNR
jgi:hypothetical protein